MGAQTHLSPDPPGGGLRSLKRRRLYKVAMGYGVVAWLAVQVTAVMAPVLFLPDWSVRLVLTLALIGLPVAMVIAWSLDGARDANLARQRVRGLAGRIVDFAIIGILAGLTAALLINDRASQRSAGDGIDSIAVMPFRDLSEQGSRTYLGDGLAGELLNQLARVDGLRVAARTSSFAFRGSDVDIREIGRHLDVDAIVEGSLRVSDRQIRITVQLIGIEDGFNIWSRTYTKHMDDILALQEEIGASIVDALRLEILGGDAGAGQTRSAEAYQNYLEGRFEFASLRRHPGFRDLMQWLRTRVSVQRSNDSGVAADTDFATSVPEDALVRSRDGATMKRDAK